MTDDTEQPEAATPELVTVTDEEVARWLAIPEDAEVHAHITRGDIDHLFFSINKTIHGMDQLQTTLVAFSNGQTDEANQSLVAMRTLTVEAANHIQAFLRSLISKTEALP